MNKKNIITRVSTARVKVSHDRVAQPWQTLIPRRKI
jgi:hypothetical protein